MHDAKRIIREVRRILDRIARAKSLQSNAATEKEFESVERDLQSLDGASVLEHLDEAIGDFERRRDASQFALCWLAGLPAAIERIRQELKNMDPHYRHTMISAIGFHSICQLAPLLNEVMLLDADHECRAAAVEAA